MEAPLPNFLSVLPIDMLRMINDRIPCLVHRRRVALVCRSFHDAVHPQHQPATPALPWVLLPRPGGPSFSCVLRGCDTHDDLDVPVDARVARYFGAYEGGWVFLALGQTQGHKLLNLRTHQRFHIPDVVRLRFISSCEAYDRRRLTMLAATLSSPPEQGRCIVAAICCIGIVIGPHFRAFWHLGHPVPVNPDICKDFGGGPCLEDVIHHSEAFCFLTIQENLLRFAARIRDDGDLEIEPPGIRLFQEEGPRYGGGEHVQARYLVESRGQLLMVVRLAPREILLKTSAFRVFQMVQVQKKPEDDGSEPVSTWNELHALGGRMPFVGRGCSRSYEKANYPGFKGVYFLDDGRFYGDRRVFELDGPRWYPFSDSGKSSAGPTPRIAKFLPEQGPSNYSPPAWFLN